jgi:hypothetical protein
MPTKRPLIRDTDGFVKEIPSGDQLPADTIPPGTNGSPGGLAGQLQFNDGGNFGGDADLTWDKTSNTLALSGADTDIDMAGITNEPASPAANTLRLYVKSLAGRMMLKQKGPSGVDTPLQPFIAQSNVSLISPGAGTTLSQIGNLVTNVGTVSHPAPAATNLKTQTRRFTNTSAGTAGSLASTRVQVMECWRGNAAGLGGFWVNFRFALTTLAAGMRAFVGLTDTATTAPTNLDPTTSTTPGKIGLAVNANTGNWNLVHNITGTAPTVIALGANFPVNTTDLLELQLFAKPNDTAVYYRVINLTTGNETSGTLTTNLPASATFLGRVIWACNNATASAVAWDCSRSYLETDY